MKYIALLRGINVGGNRKVEMKRLRNLFESLGCANVITYLNSGNVIFESSIKQQELQKEIPKELKKSLAKKYSNARQKYTAAKAEFINNILEKAKKQ